MRERVENPTLRTKNPTEALQPQLSLLIPSCHRVAQTPQTLEN